MEKTISYYNRLFQATGRPIKIRCGLLKGFGSVE